MGIKDKYKGGLTHLVNIFSLYYFDDLIDNTSIPILSEELPYPVAIFYFYGCGNDFSSKCHHFYFGSLPFPYPYYHFPFNFSFFLYIKPIQFKYERDLFIQT
jgi:hypothetical protein